MLNRQKNQINFANSFSIAKPDTYPSKLKKQVKMKSQYGLIVIVDIIGDFSPTSTKYLARLT